MSVSCPICPLFIEDFIILSIAIDWFGDLFLFLDFDASELLIEPSAGSLPEKELVLPVFCYYILFYLLEIEEVDFFGDVPSLC